MDLRRRPGTGGGKRHARHRATRARPRFLKDLYPSRSGYYPDRVVDLGRAVLVRLCARIEARRPADLPAPYVRTHAATEEFNGLQDDFEAAWQRGRDGGPGGDGGGLLVRRPGLRLHGRRMEELIAPRDR